MAYKDEITKESIVAQFGFTETTAKRYHLIIEHKIKSK